MTLHYIYIVLFVYLHQYISLYTFLCHCRSWMWKKHWCTRRYTSIRINTRIDMTMQIQTSWYTDVILCLASPAVYTYFEHLCREEPWTLSQVLLLANDVNAWVLPWSSHPIFLLAHHIDLHLQNKFINGGTGKKKITKQNKTCLSIYLSIYLTIYLYLSIYIWIHGFWILLDEKNQSAFKEVALLEPPGM